MSTRASIWFGEDKAKSVHIYWELAERTPKPFSAPIFMEVSDKGSDKEVAVRLPKEIAQAIVPVLAPQNTTDIL